MSYLAKFIELCAFWGSNCVSMCTSYQPKLPESLM